jgi:hypothetical protein
MSSTEVGAVLQYIRTLATARKDDELPDHEVWTASSGTAMRPPLPRCFSGTDRWF